MLRRAVVAVVVLAGLSLAVRAQAATFQNVLVAGDTCIASIDADNDGIINGPNDCCFHAEVGGSGDITVGGTQPSGPNQLLPCIGNCWGDTSLSSDFVEVSLDSCAFSGPPFVPMIADFCSTVQSCQSNSATSAASGGAAGGSPGAPLKIVAGEVFQGITGIRSGFGKVCAAGGAAVQVTGDDGMTVLKSLDPYPNAAHPTHLCVKDFPVELASTRIFVLRTACFPIVNNAAPIALSGDPSNPIVIVDFSTLTACSTGKAPTMTDWGLILLLMSLLGIGVWALRRRPAFASLSVW